MVLISAPCDSEIFPRKSHEKFESIWINPNALFYSQSNQSNIIGGYLCVKWNDSRRSTDRNCPWAIYVEGILTSKIVSSIIYSIRVIGKFEWFSAVMETSKCDTKPKQPFSVELTHKWRVSVRDQQWVTDKR